MAEPMTKVKWTDMAEHVQNRIIHLAFSIITLLSIFGGGLSMYWSIQAENQKLIAEVRGAVADQARRLTILEARDFAAATDRLAQERRVTVLETVYQTTLTQIQEMRTDIREALRNGSARP
jgi:hypothetical protein